MRVLIASKATQGERPGDFFRAVEGELVHPAIVCVECVLDPESRHGCGRAFVGLGSGLATTTAVVGELDLTLREYFIAVASSLTRRGYVDDVHRTAAQIVEDLMKVFLVFPLGTVAGRQMEDIYLRRKP